MTADRSDKDHMERAPSCGPGTSPGTSPGSRVTALPTNEPGGRSLEEQRADLQRVIYELQGSLKYMGAAHPQRAASELKLTQLIEILKHLDATLGTKPGIP